MLFAAPPPHHMPVLPSRFNGCGLQRMQLEHPDEALGAGVRWDLLVLAPVNPSRLMGRFWRRP
ncbi:hypothetical protein H4V99_003244 [Cryobacterium sp. CG_9.6]|nr:hypothetical protein [Cryobacterium sp. CG_9.6]